MATSAPTLPAGSGLADWIREHRVSWEMGPYVVVHHHETVPVGFSVTLSAAPPEGCLFDPGGEECAAVFERLREIVWMVVPRGARVRMEPFDASFHLRTTGGWDPGVELTAEILHREGTFEPVDESERGQLALVTRGLAALGVQKRTGEGWTKSR